LRPLPRFLEWTLKILCSVHSRVHAVARRHDAEGAEFVGDEPVAELRVVVMDVDGRVDQVGVVPVALRDRLGTPLVEGLLGEAEHPAGQR
jgi:hypothetical protein